MTIPRLIHFIWIFDGQHPSKQLLLGLRSAVLNTTCKVILHTDDHEIPQIPGVEIRYREFERNIKGIDFESVRSVNYKGKGARRIAHLSDIYRLDILWTEGGIYSDMDCLWFRNPWEFFDKKVVIGWSNKSYKILCNSVLMSEPRNRALLDYKQWLWDIYPCSKYWIPANPYKLWKDNSDVTMVDKNLFYPLRWSSDMDINFKKIEGSICCHTFYSMGQSKGEVVSALISACEN